MSDRAAYGHGHDIGEKMFCAECTTTPCQLYGQYDPTDNRLGMTLIAMASWHLRWIVAGVIGLLVLTAGDPMPERAIGTAVARETETREPYVDPIMEPVLVMGGVDVTIPTTTLPIATTTIPTTTTLPATTTTLPAPPPAPVWNPADECAKVKNPGPVYLTAATMSWCAKVAYYLDLGERLGIPGWEWLPGDLTRLVLIMECESNGEANPGGPNPNGSLFQHDGRYWSDRGPLAAEALGFTNPTRSWQYPYDSIAVGVWLFKVERSGNVRGGPGHWLSCSGFSDSTQKGRDVQATLRNMGLTIPTQRWNG